MTKPNCTITQQKLHRINVHNRRCGFFSDFLTCLAGIMYCYDNGYNFYVDWRSELYSPKDHRGCGEYNLFDKYFYQEYNNLSDEHSYDFIHNLHTPYGYYFPIAYCHINPKSVYSALYHPSYLLKELEILNSEFFSKLNKNYFQGKKVLGVHKRGTDHGLHGTIIPDEKYIDEINSIYKYNNFDKIFLITDDERSFNFFTKELGDDMISTDSFRSSHAIHLTSNPGVEVIAEQVIRDSFILSQTDYKLITRSNVSAFSLLCNLQHDNFKFLDDDIIYV